MKASEVSSNINIVGVDLAKNMFQIHALDLAVKVVLMKKLRCSSITES